MDGGGDDDDDGGGGLVGSDWKVMGLKEKREFVGLMKKVEFFLLKRESENLVENNRNEHEERELVDIIVAGIFKTFSLDFTDGRTKQNLNKLKAQFLGSSRQKPINELMLRSLPQFWLISIERSVKDGED